MSFGAHLAGLPMDELLDTARNAGEADVERALAADRIDLFDFAALLSPAADRQLERMARRAHETTVRRFGRVVQLYAPLYISNECVQTCTYCGFSRENSIRRRTLTLDEVEHEARLLRGAGFRHLLIVSGEHPRLVSADYIADVIARLRPLFPSLSVEVQPATEEIYCQWVEAGAEGLTVYQETYDRAVYREVHLAGKKKDYDWRLATPERGAAAGMKRLGIGALLGLADWRVEALHVAAHAHYLMRHFWRAFVTVSFPRLRAAAFAIAPRHPVSDRGLARLMIAMRIFLPDLGLVLSTRETPALRDGILPLGITQMSAGSRTEPGGYAAPDETEKQFDIEDARSPAEVSAALRSRGYDPVWKDWEAALNE